MTDAHDKWLNTAPTLNLVGAKKALEAAEAAAVERDLRLGIAVADAAGNLIAFVRMDGAPLISISIAAEKARTAAQLGCPTRVFQEIVDKGMPSILAAHGLTPLEGGVPVIVAGAVVGAVAASGAASADDAFVAQCGADAINAG